MINSIISMSHSLGIYQKTIINKACTLKQLNPRLSTPFRQNGNHLLFTSQQRRTLRPDPRKKIYKRGNHLRQESQHHTDSQRPSDGVKRRPLRAQRRNTVEDSDAD